MIDHFGITVADFDHAKAFYETVLAPLEGKFLHLVPAVHTGGVRFGGFGTDTPTFWIDEGRPQQPPLHFAFRTGSRSAVDAFYTAALAAGAKDNGAPGLRPHYHENYYGAFVIDLDGHNIEAVCHLPQA